MRVESIELENFRGFEGARLDFDPKVTLIVGVNGSGKTTLLEALNVMLARVHASITTRPGSGPSYKDSDVRVGASSTSCTVRACIRNEDVAWTLVHTRKGHPSTRTSELAALAPIIRQVQADNEQGRWSLPLAVMYRVTRAPEIPRRIKERHEFGPLSAYDDALAGAGASFRQFFEWFRDRQHQELLDRTERPDHVDSQLQAVRSAVSRLLPGFTDLKVQLTPHRMVVKKHGQHFELDSLSDGERVIIALAGDLARRLALANPSASDPLDCPAVVMIDEVELHLHPGWQRVVVERLRDTFPACQFILTTHSPQVIASVPTKCVRLLEDFEVFEAPVPTEGRDSNAILAELMDAGERPERFAEKLATIERLIDEERFDEARAEMTRLESTWDASAAELVRLHTLMRFVEGRDAVDPEGP